jgi:tetratricopeptide (TPR) repeat protein
VSKTVPSLGRTLAVCLFIVVVAWVPFTQTLRHDFINHDDPQYITENAEVVKGFTLPGMQWAFTHKVASNWHPLTMISHMVDCHLFGLDAGAHHRTSVLLHSLVAASLFLLLNSATGAFWPSAVVAALFAIHPLRVESVAWVSERKDVLSGLFFALTLAAYVHYVRHRSWVRYAVVLILFALGLMAKPMLVTLPLVLLLLDYWPLRRPSNEAHGATWGSLVVEKLPLLALSAVACAITLLMQTKTLSSTAMIPFWLRCYNVSLSSVTYLRQMFWPTDLGLFYPYPSGVLSMWPFLLAVILLAAVTYVSWRYRKERPYLLVGWWWYLIMLAPVIGLVQVGRQAHADRYTYLPQIGLAIAIIWAVADLAFSRRIPRPLLGGLAVAVISVLAWAAHRQASYWRDSETIWLRTLAVTSNNAVAHKSLGGVLLKKAQVERAMFHLNEALKISPDAIGDHRDPENASLHQHLGIALAAKGQLDGAISHYRKALELRPDYHEVHEKLAGVLWRRGDTDQATRHWQKALELRPDDPNLHASIATAYTRERRFADAISHYERSLAAAPDAVVTLNNFALVLASASEADARDGARAIELASRAEKLSNGQNASAIRTLAAAYAETGRFEEAIRTAERARDIAAAQGDTTFVNEVALETDLYRVNLPRRMR